MAAVVAATLVTVGLGAVLVKTPASPFLAAVALAAWLGGLGPALVASGLSAVAINYCFTDPGHGFSLSLGDAVGAAVFLMVSLLITSLTAGRRRAEVSVSIGEARLSGIIASAMDAIISVDEHRHIVLFNEAAERMFRCPAASALGTSVERFLPSPSRGGRDAAARRHGGPMATTAGTLVARRADGEEFPIEAAISRVEASGQTISTVIIRDVTERLRAEQALRENEARFRRLMEANILGMVVSELDGRIIDANDAFLDLVGYHRDDLAAGRVRWDALTAPEYLETSQRRVAELRARGACTPFEKEYVRKDGSRVPVLIGVAALDASHERGVGFVLDLTEQRRAADVLRFLAEASTVLAASADSDAALKTIARVAVPGLADWCVVDLLGEGGVLRRVAIAHSDPAREARGWRITRRFPPRAGARHGPGRVVRTGEPELVTHLPDGLLAAVASDGEHLAVLRGLGLVSYISAPLSARGRILGAITFASAESGRRYTAGDLSIIGDVAHRVALGIDNARLYREAEAARATAETAEKRAKFLAEASGMLASSLDYELALQRVARLAVPYLADWCVVDVADEQEVPQRIAVTHADPERAPLARDLALRYRPSPEGRTLPDVVRARRGEIVELGEADLRALARDAEHARLLAELGTRSLLAVPLLARGRALGGITFVRGEGRPGFDGADLALAEDLAARAALAVDNARLYREAQSAIRTKDDFLAIVSHELRTPLQSMFGWVRLLRAGVLDGPTFERALEAIERNTRLQGQLINDLLDVSGIIRGKIRLDLHAVDLASVVESAVDAVRLAAEAKGVALDVHAAPVGLVWGDSARLQQVVGNLLANAVKFTPRDGRVDVRLQQDGDHAVIGVADTGRGIHADFLPHIFDRFRQAESSTTRPHGGLGLGLAIVRHLVEMHRGSVHAHSAGEGRGAVFTVRLPLEVPGAAAPRPARALTPGESHATAAGAATLRGLRVLLVDDEPDARELLMTALERFGASVTAVGSARDAIDVLRRDTPDVLVSDIGMPEKDGYALIREVRSLAPDAGGHVPAAALTAYARLEDRERALAAGFQIHVAKPVDPAHLATTVARLAGRG